jgi:hypothetical protein
MRIALTTKRESVAGAGGGSPVQGRTAAGPTPVDQHRHLLRGVRRLHELGAHVTEEPYQVDLLLICTPEDRRLLLPDDGHYRFRVELRVVEAVEQMHRTRALGRQADTDPAGVLGMTDGHERRRLLVPRLYEGRLSGAAQRTHYAVDTVAGVTEDAFHAPVRQPLHQQIRDRTLRHVLLPPDDHVWTTRTAIGKPMPDRRPR